MAYEVRERDDGHVEIDDVVVLRVTDRGGVLIRLDDGAEVWVPQQAIHADSEVWNENNAGPGTLVIPTKMATEKGIL